MKEKEKPRTTTKCHCCGFEGCGSTKAFRYIALHDEWACNLCDTAQPKSPEAA